MPLILVGCDPQGPSSSIKESKDLGVFISEFEPNKNKLSFHDNEYEIDFVFRENYWIKQGLIYRPIDINRNNRSFYIAFKTRDLGDYIFDNHDDVSMKVTIIEGKEVYKSINYGIIHHEKTYLEISSYDINDFNHSDSLTFVFRKK